MLEKEFEKKFVLKVKENGGKAYKFVSPSTRGVPDRIVVFPGNNISFVELKTGKNRLTSLQEKQIGTLKGFGCRVHILNDRMNLDEFIGILKSGDCDEI